MKTSEDELRKIVDTIPAPVWSGHPDGSAEFFNRRRLDYAGPSAEEVQGCGAVHRARTQRCTLVLDIGR